MLPLEPEGLAEDVASPVRLEEGVEAVVAATEVSGEDETSSRPRV